MKFIYVRKTSKELLFTHLCLAVCLILTNFTQAQNLARNATPHTSSFYQNNASWNGYKARDGVTSANSKWVSNGDANPWIYFDLGAEHNLGRVLVKMAGAGGEWTAFNAKAYNIQTWNNGWVNRANVNNSSQQNEVSTNITARSRYVRLNFTDTGIDQYARIPEIEVYAATSTGATNLQASIPQCSNSAYTANFSWTGSGNGWWIDVSTNSSFPANTATFHKPINNTSSTNSNGLCRWHYDCSSQLALQPNTTYYWRIWNGSSHSQVKSFRVNNCAAACESLYGIHWWASGASSIMNGKKGWSTEIINIHDITSASHGSLTNFKNKMRSVIADGFTPVVRINWNWNATIPDPNQISYSAFAQRCAMVMDQLHNHLGGGQSVKWFQIGNEYNLDYEYPPAGGAPVSVYVNYYNAVYNQIKTQTTNGQNMKVLVGPVANWAPTAVNGSLGTGYYDAYFKAVVNSIGQNCDGYAIHTYGAHDNGNRSYAGGISINWGQDNNLGRAGNVLPGNFNKSNTLGFNSYRVLMQIIRSYGKSTVPVIITETNTSAHYTITNNSNCSNPVTCNSGNCKLIRPSITYYSGWMQTAYQRINNWNNNNSQKILGLCWFVYDGQGDWEEFGLDNSACKMTTARNDFNSLTASTNYSAGCNAQNRITRTQVEIPTTFEPDPTQRSIVDQVEALRIEKLFPVPTNKVLNVQFSTESREVEVNIFTQQGKLFKTKKVSTQQGKQTFTINVSDLPKGFYLLSITDKSGKVVRSFVID
ncbi:hypothetical protein BKI52_02285 [marine bacterium AO1-C]|nr:hypothetical protein BKI52_02285 [marine bacterium AO1-C]